MPLSVIAIQWLDKPRKLLAFRQYFWWSSIASAFSPFFANASQIRLRIHPRKLFLKTRFYIIQRGLLVWGGWEGKAEVTFKDQNWMCCTRKVIHKASQEKMYLFISRIGYSPFFPVLHGGFLHFHFKIPRKKKALNIFFSKAHYLLILAAAGLLCWGDGVWKVE